MANPLLNVKVKSTGKIVQVYKHVHGSYVDYSDCDTMYKPKEIEFMKPAK